MNSHLKQQRFILVIVAAATVMTIAWKPMFGWHRPYVNWAAWDLAQYLVDHGRDPRECLDLISIQIMAPQQGEQRALCVFEYAKIAKDSLACELLMPSNYGWNCLAAAEQIEDRLCWFDFTKSTENNSAGRMPECGGRQNSDASRCCDMARNLYVEKIDSCEPYADSEKFHDQCQELLALEKENIGLCDAIINDRIRSNCTVSVRAITQR